MITALKWTAGILLSLLLLVSAGILYIGWSVGILQPSVYEHQSPARPAFSSDIRLLVFTKTNGFRHKAAIPASIEMFERLADKNDWQVYATENAAVHDLSWLSEFDVVIWSNVSGDVLLETQRDALRSWIETGGVWLGIHGSGGDPSYKWDWYRDELLRAQFRSHPMFPNVRHARLNIEASDHPTLADMPDEWAYADEWYGFEESPRPVTNVLISLDETSYAPGRSAMGTDHPTTWTHRVADGWAYYTALGHTAQVYQDPQFQGMIERAVLWLAAKNRHRDGSDTRGAPNGDK